MVKFIGRIYQSILKSRSYQQFQVLLIVCTLLTIGIFHSGCNPTPQNVNEEAKVIATLDKFLRAFENGNFEIMEASMAEDSYVFPRAIMSKDIVKPIDNTNYRRIKGLDPQMKQLIKGLRESGKQPPYLNHLEPKDLKITMLNDAAIATFHLENGKSLSRRTIVLGKNEGEWKIIHIHPSNVVSSE